MKANAARARSGIAVSRESDSAHEPASVLSRHKANWGKGIIFRGERHYRGKRSQQHKSHDSLGPDRSFVYLAKAVATWPPPGNEICNQCNEKRR